MLRQIQRVSVLPLLVLLTACPQKTAIWVRQGSTVHHLEFMLSDRIGGSRPISLHYLEIYRCFPRGAQPRDTMWVLDGDGGTEARSIVYGVAPPGFTEPVRARPLGTGCYDVRTDGTGRTRFVVETNGSVRQENP